MRSMQATRGAWVARLAAMALATGSVCPSAFAASGDGWQFNVVPYLWLPAVHGSADVTVRDLRGGDGEPLGQVDVSAEIDPDDYLSNLHFALMFIAEARKGPWSIYTDLMYAQFDNQDTRLKSITGPRGNLSTEISRKAEVDVSSTIWTLGGGYNLIDRPDLLLDLVAGFRYMTMDSDLTLSLAGPDGVFSRSHEESLDQDVWDGILGVKGQIRFPDTRWFVPYYLDVGTGSSNWTWQALLGAGYRFDWGEVTLAVKSLSYDFGKDDADVRFTGPALGVGFRW
jgi:hypothetical protein